VSSPPLRSRHHFFLVACSLEGGLGVLAIGLNYLLGAPLLGDMSISGNNALKGVIATIPPLAFFIWSLTTSWTPLHEVQQILEKVVRHHFQPWSLLQLLLISSLAGIGEELLFRGAIQGNLIGPIGVIPAVAVASLLFGLCHSMTRAYLVVTFIMGIYLGTLHIVTQDLITPVVTHALYDFLALVYFLRVHPTAPLPTDP